MKTFLISLALGASFLFSAWSTVYAKTNAPCTAITYYYMDLPPAAATPMDHKISRTTKEVKVSLRQCRRYRQDIHTGRPKQKGGRTLLDATCAPCGLPTKRTADLRKRNMLYWEFEMQSAMAKVWSELAGKNARRIGLQLN